MNARWTETQRLIASACLVLTLGACDDGGSDDGGGTMDATTTATSSPTTTNPSTSGPTTDPGTTSSMPGDDSTTGSMGSSSGEDATSTSSGSDGGSESTGDSGSDSSGGQTSEACFDGGNPAPGGRGDGTCANPYTIDLSMQPHGTILTHTFVQGADEMDMGGGCVIPPVGTARDVVYHVLMPDDVMELHVSVDAAAGADPRIAVAEDPSCFQPMNACADELGAGACEGVVAPRGGAGFFGTSTYVVINEFVDSNVDLTVRFRTAN